MNTIDVNTITTVTVPAGGIVRRKFEQTARYDHDVELSPGIYEVNPRRSPEGSVTHYVASIPAVNTITGEAETWGLYLYASEYFVKQAESVGFLFESN